MATFQLAGMPSLQVANQNAPGVGVAPVPQYVTQPNLGQTLIGGLGNLAGAYAQNKQLQFQKDFGQAYASGDREALKQLAASNPDQIPAIQQGLGFIDAEKNKQIGNAASDLQLAAITGPQAVQVAAQKHAGALQQLGITPEAAVQAYQQNPQQFSQYADLIGMHALGPEQYYTLQANQQKLQQTGQIAQANLGLKQQQLQQQAQYQQGQLDQGQQKINIDRQDLGIKSQLADIRRMEAQNKANSNTVKGQQNLQKIIATKSDAVTAYDNQVNVLSNSLDAVNQVKAIPAENFDRVFGFGGAVNSSIPGSESADAWSAINRLQSQARLMGMQALRGTGQVSNAEGMAAQQALLAINQNTSPNAARKAIDQYLNVLQRAKRGIQQQEPLINGYRQEIKSFAGQRALSPQVSAGGISAGTVQDGYTFIGGNPADKNNWRKN